MFNKKAYDKEYYQKRKEHIREKKRVWLYTWRKNNPEHQRAYTKKRRDILKVGVLAHYSGGIPQCACCGEQYSVFLTIDHINGGGHKHRTSLGLRGGEDFYRWLRKNNHPPGYRVLCFNCNFAIYHLGSCPHALRKL